MDTSAGKCVPDTAGKSQKRGSRSHVHRVLAGAEQQAHLPCGASQQSSAASVLWCLQELERSLELLPSPPTDTANHPPPLAPDGKLKTAVAHTHFPSPKAFSEACLISPPINKHRDRLKKLLQSFYWSFLEYWIGMLTPPKCCSSVGCGAADDCHFSWPDEDYDTCLHYCVTTAQNNLE